MYKQVGGTSILVQGRVFTSAPLRGIRAFGVSAASVASIRYMMVAP